MYDLLLIYIYAMKVGGFSHLQVNRLMDFWINPTANKVTTMEHREVVVGFPADGESVTFPTK